MLLSNNAGSIPNTVPSVSSVPPLAEALAQQARVQAVAVPNGHVTWRCFGRGPALVLLHGGHGSWLHWVKNIETLARGHTVCVPDMPGYGDSSTPSAPTLDALLDDLQQSLDRLLGSTTPIGLAGFSFGGLVAAHLAARRGYVHRLALLGTAGHGSPRRERSALKNWRLPQARGDDEGLHAVMRHNLLALMLYDEQQLDQTALHIHTVSCLGTRFHSRTLSQTADLRQALDQVQVPTRLIWGEHDVTATPQALTSRLTDGHANRCLQLIPGVGHWVAYEASEVINAHLMDFFHALPDRQL